MSADARTFVGDLTFVLSRRFGAPCRAPAQQTQFGCDDITATSTTPWHQRSKTRERNADDQRTFRPNDPGSFNGEDLSGT
jgi:hypothetical protein